MDKVKSFLKKQIQDRVPPSVLISSSKIPQSPFGAFPSQEDFYRYRKQRGVNLGSWFVLEPWLTDVPYRNAVPPAESDHDVARGLDAKSTLEQHWDTWIVEEDWKWIAEHGFNSVRIPIGFYHLCGANAAVLDGTDFADLYDVFSGAWKRITCAIETAHRYGIGVLIDLHAAPGKQNADSHSGTSSSNVAFFEQANLKRTASILASLLRQLVTYTHTHNPPLPNLIGIELVNEPRPPQPHNFFHDWYRFLISALRNIDPELPLYVSDSWREHDYAGMLVSADNSFPGFLDDHAQSAEQHAAALRGEGGTPAVFQQVNRMMTPVGAGLVVGEWSAALNPASLRDVSDPHAAQRTFVDAQLELYERECAGWFFWTYRKQWPGDTGWCMRDAVGAGVFPPYVGLRKTRVDSEDGGWTRRRDKAKREALEQHTAYWKKYPGQYEHWRFEEGYLQGWEDAYMFFSSSTTIVAEIGFKTAWIKRRIDMHAQRKGLIKNLWEYGHGLQQGMDAAKADYLLLL
ncbi:glycoside hydrolase [Vararia minispora EC-137]|uniref:Glycoside hydrolase n=1 Tax=Vararia minispora EC-137 TaxID=1314806 RepID=A0ACB8QV42_9AGAM|nr:glycoside hydrolase [Vararia minispora EC-137]